MVIIFVYNDLTVTVDDPELGKTIVPEPVAIRVPDVQEPPEKAALAVSMVTSPIVLDKATESVSP